MKTIFHRTGSRGSSSGSRLFHCCYPRKAPSLKTFRALGSRGSSTFNFLADFKKVKRHFREMGTKFVRITDKVSLSATSATRTAKIRITTGFRQVAVPERIATLTATNCYPHYITRR